MNQYNVTAEHIAEAKKHGSAKIQEGSWLSTKAAMIEEQQTWDDGDEAKNIDFSGCDFWVTTDDGQGPFGVNLSEIQDN